jgi:hypothetical protein
MGLARHAVPMEGPGARGALLGGDRRRHGRRHRLAGDHSARHHDHRHATAWPAHSDARCRPWRAAPKSQGERFRCRVFLPGRSRRLSQLSSETSQICAAAGGSGSDAFGAVSGHAHVASAQDFPRSDRADLHQGAQSPVARKTGHRYPLSGGERRRLCAVRRRGIVVGVAGAVAAAVHDLVHARHSPAQHRRTRAGRAERA